MGERIAGEQHMPSLITEGPPGPTPQIAKNIIFLHFGPYMNNWFLIVFPYEHMSSL